MPDLADDLKIHATIVSKHGTIVNATLSLVV
jgi:hypothetical protein